MIFSHLSMFGPWWSLNSLFMIRQISWMCNYIEKYTCLLCMYVYNIHLCSLDPCIVKERVHVIFSKKSKRLRKWNTKIFVIVIMKMWNCAGPAPKPCGKCYQSGLIFKNNKNLMGHVPQTYLYIWHEFFCLSFLHILQLNSMFLKLWFGVTAGSKIVPWFPKIVAWFPKKMWPGFQKI